MKILIIAIDHELQKVKRVDEVGERAVRKERLEALLKQKIAERKVEFLSEESDPDTLTIAKQLSDANEPRIPWKNISMPEDERKKAGVYEALKNRGWHAEWRDGELVWIDHRIAEDDTLEEYFCEQTKRGAGGSQSILILCGDLHVEALKEKLKRDGHHVETHHGMVEKRWT